MRSEHCCACSRHGRLVQQVFFSATLIASLLLLLRLLRLRPFWFEGFFLTLEVTEIHMRRDREEVMIGSSVDDHRSRS